MTEPVNRPGFIRERTKLFYILIGIVVFLCIILIFRNFSEKNQAATLGEIVNWKSYFFEPISLRLMVPSELTVHTEEPNPGVFTAYIQNFPFNAPYPEDNAYQLYIVWQKDYPLTQDEFNQKKNNLIWPHIVDTTISGYPAIKGQIQGERSRFVTYIYKDTTLISLLAANSTENNKHLTDKILSTFAFKP